MTHELRCEHKLHMVLIDSDTVEVGCSSRLCGAGAGIVVRHRFSLTTKKLLSTTRYKSPERTTAHGRNDRPDSPLRTP